MRRVKTAAAENIASTSETEKTISVKIAIAVLMNTNSVNTADYVLTVVKAKANVPTICA